MTGPSHTPTLPGGDLELALLDALWASGGPTTARELYERVGAPRNLVYTTVAKVLDRLVGKQLVQRRKSGRMFAYRALAGRAETHRAMARILIKRLAGDDLQPAVAALVGAIEDVSPELLDQLGAELAARKGSK